MRYSLFYRFRDTGHLALTLKDEHRITGLVEPRRLAFALTSFALTEGLLSPTLARILVVEDFIPFRSFLTSLLQQRSEWQVVAEASDGLEAVQKARELSPDLILLDIGLPNLNGIEAARQIRQLAPKSRIVFVTQESSADVVQEALALGAHGYLLKVNVASELSAAVDAVLKGKRFVSSGLDGHGSSGTRDPDTT